MYQTTFSVLYIYIISYTCACIYYLPLVQFYIKQNEDKYSKKKKIWGTITFVEYHFFFT